jgi:LmbE family N-acetylglucosaminyl deacetylase
MQLEPTLTKPLRILVIAAHPDDIEFGAGGSVIRWTDAGAQVMYCLVTNGAAGSNEKDTDLKELIKRREEEQKKAAEIAGVHDVRFFGYQDGILEPSIALRRDLTRLIRELRPDRVVINDPTYLLVQDENMSYINHPDHIASATAALYAVFPSAGTRPIFPELLDEGLEPHNVPELFLMFTDKPNLAVDISSARDRKIQALLCHRSQLGEEAIEFVDQFDKEVGKELGVEFAESFRVMRFVNETDAAKDDPAD